MSVLLSERKIDLSEGITFVGSRDLVMLFIQGLFLAN